MGVPAYSRHVLDRMQQRGITRTQIEHVLTHPTSIEKTPDNSLRYIGVFPTGRELKVWVVDPPPSEGAVIVKSAAWKD